RILCILDCSRKSLEAFVIGFVQIEIGLWRRDGAGCEDHAFEYEMRAVFEEQAIFKTARLVFTGIRDNVSNVSWGFRRNVPFSADWKSRTASPAESRSDNFFKDVSADWLIAAAGAVFLEGFVVSRPSFGKKNHWWIHQL